MRGLLADDIAWHVPGRSPIAGHYHGHQEILGYFAARRAHAKATFRVRSRAILADDEWAVQLADGQLERDGQLRTWQTVGVFRIAGGKIAECWLVPFDQYLFDELWSCRSTRPGRHSQPALRPTARRPPARPGLGGQHRPAGSSSPAAS
jgi:uncharacterized protein